MSSLLSCRFPRNTAVPCPWLLIPSSTQCVMTTHCLVKPLRLTARKIGIPLWASSLLRRLFESISLNMTMSRLRMVQSTLVALPSTLSVLTASFSSVILASARCLLYASCPSCRRILPAVLLKSCTASLSATTSRLLPMATFLPTRRSPVISFQSLLVMPSCSRARMTARVASSTA